MLKKIIAIRNVGRFVNSALPGTPGLAKCTLVYGANGFGKTTICAILRSLATNDPSLVTGRARLGATEPPQIELLLDSGPAAFKNGSWTTPAPQITVFDGTFIAENVHSGEAVDLEQKRNLYRVIVGKEGVGFAIEEERLANESRLKGADAKNHEKALLPFIPVGMKLDDFISLPNDPGIDSAIAAQSKNVEAAKLAADIKARPALSEILLPKLPQDFETLLAKTLEGIAEDAQTQIAGHLSRHQMAEDGEDWISRGVDHIVDDTCPFCGQSVSALDLISAYRQVFGEAYRGLKNSVDSMHSAIERDWGDRAIGSIETLMEKNRGSADFWARFCELPDTTVPSDTVTTLSELRKAAINLLVRKAAAPQELVKPGEPFISALARYKTTFSAIEAHNVAVRAANVVIESKRNLTTAGDLKKEEATLARLNSQRKRHEPEVSALCVAYSGLIKEKDDIDKAKIAVRSKLDEYTKRVIKPYEARINELLDNFNAGFGITQTKPAYAGGVASSTYQIVINSTSIDLGDGKTPADRPSFKNTLSAGDRTTLALAFFLAYLERDPDFVERIVAFDDPFMSQDSFRRRQTVHEIKKVGAACDQVIVLSHDASFLRQVRDKHSASDCIAVQLSDHRSNGVKISACDLDEACRGRVASEMDDLQTYVTSGAGKDRDIIKKMRIVLETYCRATYPSLFSPEDRLGGMVEKIKKVGDQHPAWAIADQLELINEFSRDHHHGDDPQDGTSDIIDPTELTGFVKRTLRLVNNLQA